MAAATAVMTSRPSESQSVFNQPPHRCADGGAQSLSDLKCDFVQIGLHVFKAGVEHVVHFGLGGHLWQVFMAMHHLHHVDDLLAQLLADLFPADLSLLLVRQTDNVHLEVPNFPGDTLVRKRPPGFLLLVKLQGDLAHAVVPGVVESVL